MENSPLDPVETRETLETLETLVTQLRSATSRKNPRRSRRTPGTHVDTIFIRRIGRSGSMRADRSGKRRMGHRMTVTRRAPTQPPILGSRACRAAGGVARSCHAGDASNASVRAPGRCVRRSSERRHARRARHRGVARILPRAGLKAGESGRTGGDGTNGNGERGADDRSTTVVTSSSRRAASTTVRQRAGRTARGRDASGDPLVHRSWVRTPASSRSDRRPDGRRRRSPRRPAPRAGSR